MTDYASALPVRGPVVAGATAAATDTLLPVMGSDGTAYRIFKTDANGNQYAYITDGTNTASIQAGTNKALRVAISDGTDDLDVLVVDSAFGATPKAIAVVGKYESTPTTYAAGDAVPFLTDANGRLITVPYGTGGAIAETYTHDSVLLTKGSSLQEVVSLTPGAKEYITGLTMSGSGLARFEVQYGLTGAEATIMAFYNSTANPNIIWNVPQDTLLDCLTTQTIKIMAENIERAASPASDFTAYGTIISHA